MLRRLLLVALLFLLPCAATAQGINNPGAAVTSCTWTPTDGSGAGLTFSSVSSSCQKVGRHVLVSASLTYPATANTSVATLAGLPFTSAATFHACAVATNASGVAAVGLLSVSGTTIALDNITAAVGLQNVQFTGAVVIVTCSYISAS